MNYQNANLNTQNSIMLVQPTGDKRGHYGIYIIKLSKALAIKGYRVIVVTNDIDTEEYGGVPDGVEIVRVMQGRLKFKENYIGLLKSFYYWFQYFRNSLIVTYSALKIAKNRQIPRIYITDCEFLLASVLLICFADPLRRIFMQINAANFSYGSYRGGVLKKIYKSIQTTFLKLAIRNGFVHAVNTLGTWHANILARQLDLSHRFPLYVIPDGGDITEGPVDKTLAREQLKFPIEAFIILAFGNFRRDKDYLTLLKAISEFNNHPLFLVMVGHPAEFTVEELNRLIDNVGARSKVLWTYFDFAPANLVKLIFSASDALILPYAMSYVDGSGPLRKEASNYCRPIIGSDVAEIGYLIREHDLGLVYEAGNVADLIKTFYKFLETTGTKRDLWGKNSRNLGLRNSWEKMAERFIDVFNLL